MRTVASSAYGKATGIEKRARDAAKFLVNNRPRVEMSESDIESFKSVRTVTDTPIVEMFNKLTSEGLLQNNFFTMDLSNVSDIPTILTLDEISVDGSIFDSLPEELQTIWVNVAPVMGKRSTRTQEPIITDTPRFMGYYVRGQLCLAYTESEKWLSPALMPFVIESYSMAARRRVAQAFNLEPEDATMVQTAFAYHYAKQLAPEDEDAEEFPKLLNRCGFLGSVSEIQDRIKFLNDASDQHFYSEGLRSLCQAVAAAGPPRMDDKFSEPAFYRLFSMGNIDNMSLSIATTFPPYWTYLLIKYSSGGKNALMGNLFNLTYMKRKLKSWIDGVVKYKGLFIER